jgi:DnaJ-class molecular chaperone
MMKETKCAFCKGKGIDPFELLSPASTCSVCGGKGKVNVEKPYIKCAFCHGTGVYPHTRLSCTICSGKGVVTFREPRMICPECKGSGREPLSGFPCLRCGGMGVIRKDEEISPGQASKKDEKLVENPEQKIYL